MNDSDLIEIILTASPVVQTVMVLLAIMSLAAWSVAFAKSYQVRKALREAKQFEKIFWETQELSSLYHQVESNRHDAAGLALIFADGFKEFARLKQQGVQEAADLVSGAQRTMKIAFSRQSDALENHLSLLATVGSSAPYIGLFGTVWGVMHAFQSLGDVQHATLAAVAPGISEALIATAIGLFAAIPAVIAYNRLTNKVDRLLNEYENFSEGFLTILHRQAHSV
ncbi:Tol-Pal system subunit TolQ [Thiomicrorhabdus immobilis]|uniref:Tol-Pal system protein TolQ n=1 Tax=Thiomicrorhabdus immobilis TaxID=2791037 RepID=A0ABM7MDX9_9GAMM|nr:protein TolQ [Thiomicrorhabdus immobilis]BCN93604.1 Tol-Pal system subunit TolQ [Thiomicrorhabdus immobilis]